MKKKYFIKFSYNNKYKYRVSKLSFFFGSQSKYIFIFNLYYTNIIFRCVKRDLLFTNERIRMIECQQINMIGIANLNSYKKI